MRVLIATDGSECSKAAVVKSCEIIKPASTVKIVSVYEDVLPVAMEQIPISAENYQLVEDSLFEMASTNVADAEAELKNRFSDGDLEITSEVLRGFPDQAIIEEARNWKADMIIVGSHGRGFLGRMLGSVSDSVVHHAPCTVVVVRGSS